VNHLRDPLTTIFPGDGEMARRCRQFAWDATPLGPSAVWPSSLKTLVSMLLSSRHPMFLFWGPDLIQFYNDAYRPSLGDDGRHPSALGARGRDCWADFWDIVGPQIDQALAGEATWHENQLVPMVRNGRVEDVYWTYGYSPARGDDGRIQGALVICQETTEQVLGKRARSLPSRCP
jgi:hypothetical protein